MLYLDCGWDLRVRVRDGASSACRKFCTSFASKEAQLPRGNNQFAIQLRLDSGWLDWTVRVILVNQTDELARSSLSPPLEFCSFHRLPGITVCSGNLKTSRNEYIRVRRLLNAGILHVLIALSSTKPGPSLEVAPRSPHQFYLVGVPVLHTISTCPRYSSAIVSALGRPFAQVCPHSPTR